MPETTTAAPAVKANNPTVLDTPQTVERNGVSATLQIFEGKRGTWEGKKYQAFQIETDGTESDVAEDKTFLACLRWFGKSNIKNAINVISRRYGQDFVEDSIPESGENAGIFSIDRFLNFWKELRSSAMKLSELNEVYQSTVEEYTKFTTGDLMAAVTSGDANAIADCKKRMEALNSTLKSLKSELDERKARRSKEAATETVANQ